MLEMLLTNCTKKQIMALALFIFMIADAFGLPIAADFPEIASEISGERRSEPKNDSNSQNTDSSDNNKTTTSWRNLDFNVAYNWNYYDQLILKLESLFNHLEAEDTLAKTVPEDIDEVDNHFAPEVADLVVEEFQLVDDFIRQTTDNANSSESTIVSEINGVAQPNTKLLSYGGSNYSRLNLSIDSSDLLGSALAEQKKKSAVRQRQLNQQTSISEALGNILLALMSPITLVVILLSVILYKLSSGQS